MTGIIILQCAWCNYDAPKYLRHSSDSITTIETEDQLFDTSHGICNDCKTKLVSGSQQ